MSRKSYKLYNGAPGLNYTSCPRWVVFFFPIHSFIHSFIRRRLLNIILYYTYYNERENIAPGVYLPLWPSYVRAAPEAQTHRTSTLQ